MLGPEEVDVAALEVLEALELVPEVPLEAAEVVPVEAVVD